MKNIDAKKTLGEVGERYIVRDIIGSLSPSNMLLDGFGHDAAFVDLSISDKEILVINSDRSGLNIAYQLGLAGAECVGDLGVSHAISDVVAAGGCPRTITVALLLPSDTEVGFVRKLMKGVERAATRYNVIFTGGDTKKNPKFAMVVTAIGTALKENRLRRSTAQKGDALVVTGYLGSMLLGTIAFKNNLDLSSNVRCLLKDALINQHPPFKLGRAFADAGIANACMDISDGLSGTLFGICKASKVGAVIDESKLPINPELTEFANSLGLRPMQLTLAGGDWQYLYSICTDKLDEAENIASKIGFPITVIGNIVEPYFIAALTSEGDYKNLKRIEHDSFIDKLGGKGYFENLAKPLECFEEDIDSQIIDKALKA
jgi:thiamine-monophosphate kinase